MKKPMNLKPLKIISINETPQFIKMSADGVHYVHGSNSNSFAGLVRFRALLSMEEIDGTSWFDRNGLHSGERGYTRQYLYQNQPVSQGVNMHYLQNYQESLSDYSSYGLSHQSYPVLYGFFGDIFLNMKFKDHPVSKGGVNIDFIRGIYVPGECVADAKFSLRSIPRLQDIVFPLLN